MSPAEAIASDNRITTLAGLYFLAFLPALVVYLFWLNRAFRNLGQVRSGNAPLRHSSGWAVGGYFVPFLNLFQPFQVMRELYKESNPEERPSSLVGWWWGLWLAGGFVTGGLLTGFGESLTVAEAITADYRTMVQDGLLMVDAVLIILIINRILTWQESRARELSIS